MADDGLTLGGHAGTVGHVPPGTYFGISREERDAASSVRGGYRTRTTPPGVPAPEYAGTLEERSVDQIERLHRFIRVYPQISITSPRQNGGLEWEASWPQAPRNGGEPVMLRASHSELRYLLDHLEREFPL